MKFYFFCGAKNLKVSKPNIENKIKLKLIFNHCNLNIFFLFSLLPFILNIYLTSLVAQGTQLFAILVHIHFPFLNQLSYSVATTFHLNTLFYIFILFIYFLKAFYLVCPSAAPTSLPVLNRSNLSAMCSVVCFAQWRVDIAIKML